MHLQVEEKQIRTTSGIRTVRKETMIFPRYHQLDVVRKLVSSARVEGSGHNYLIEHSAGSGKSNSIAWLAHRLAGLHDAHDKKVFNSVVVITDRLVLEQQLQDPIYQFEHKKGVVEKIDDNTQQLAKALANNVPIVISTIQKFPFIAQAINTLAKKGEAVKIDSKDRLFAVIVDEAHSSAAGESAQELRGILNKEGIEAIVAAQMLDEENDDSTIRYRGNFGRRYLILVFAEKTPDRSLLLEPDWGCISVDSFCRRTKERSNIGAVETANRSSQSASQGHGYD